jgi:hypothetical protein
MPGKNNDNGDQAGVALNPPQPLPIAIRKIATARDLSNEPSLTLPTISPVGPMATYYYCEGMHYKHSQSVAAKLV